METWPPLLQEKNKVCFLLQDIKKTDKQVYCMLYKDRPTYYRPLHAQRFENDDEFTVMY